jgi:hypothetical protein
VKKFRLYLLGIKFKVVTDCAAVKQAFLRQELNHRIGKWVLELGEYDFEIIHRGNQHMRHADALSRNPIQQLCVNAIGIKEDDWLLAAQTADLYISQIKEILLSGDLEGNRDVFQCYTLKGGKVYKLTSRGTRGLIPKAIRFQLLRIYHDDMGHGGQERTYELISKQFWFKGMRKFVHKYVRNCLNCVFFKSPSGKKPGFLHPIPKVPKPFHTVHIDHVGPFLRTKSGNTQILVIVDAFTKFIQLYAIKSTKPRYTVAALRELIKSFGVPKRIISDRGTSFTSNGFKVFTDQFGIAHHLNAVGMPRGNGQVERYNRTILNSLATMG